MPGRISSREDSPEEETAQLPILPVPSDPIICVEHPCIIKNLDRGIKSLGGENAINKLFEGGSNPQTFEASLRPDDPMAKTLMSKRVDVKQLLLKVTVPRRTGRKRKRDTNGPFLPDPARRNLSTGSAAGEGNEMLQSLRDNMDIASIEVVGKIGDTHRFRNMPDFQYAASTSSLAQNLRSSIFTTDYTSIRDFKYNMSRELPLDQDVGPPPFFTVVKQPFNYSYKQNPYIKTFTDAEGNVRVANTTAPIKHIRHNIDPDAPSVPDGPPQELAPLESTPPKIQQAVKQLRKMFEDRPLMQRRVFVNKFQGRQSENELKAAVGYCGYAFTSGPWRDTLVKFGIDPRKDPKYRVYQTVSYQLLDDRKGAADDPGSYIKRVGGKRITSKKEKVEHSHMFDGTKFYKDGKVWQACDVTDPMLKELLDKAELREMPDMIFSGWYGNGTWSLFRRIMKYKIQTLAAGQLPNDEMCRAVCAMFPCFITDENVHLTRLDEPGSFLSQSADYKDYVINSEAASLASEVRATAMAAFRYRNKAHKGRMTPRRGSTASQVSQGDVEMTDVGALRKELGKKSADRAMTEVDVDEDAALIGLESESEEENDEEEADEGAEDEN